jgi:uncharacterized protein YecA (UPF0149 family)
MDRLDAVVKTLAEHPLVVVLPTRNSDGAWISALFGNKLFEIEDAKEANRQLKSLKTAYNKLVELNNEQKLVYPFGKEILNKKEDLDTIVEWTRGIFQAIRLHPDYWVFTRNIQNESKFSSEIDITTCTAIILGIAEPSSIPELFNPEQFELDENQTLSITACLLVMLPRTIDCMMKYAQAIKDGIIAIPNNRVVKPKKPLVIVKIGRNDPCSCGSGKKFKKCCGK